MISSIIQSHQVTASKLSAGMTIQLAHRVAKLTPCHATRITTPNVKSASKDEDLPLETTTRNTSDQRRKSETGTESAAATATTAIATTIENTAIKTGSVGPDRDHTRVTATGPRRTKLTRSTDDEV